MEKGNKQNFIEIPLSSFNRKQYQLPASIFQTRFAPSAKNLVEFRKIIEAHAYQCISLISEERIIYACKQMSKNKICAVEIKELPHSQKNLYLLINITVCLRNHLKPFFLMKNWRIDNKVCLQDEKGNGVALVEYNLAETDLRNYIDRKRESNEKISAEEIYTIFGQLVDSLYMHHIQNKVLNDIRPETILLENGKWFILQGELAENVTFQYGTNLAKPILNKPMEKTYMSPLQLEAVSRVDNTVNHNAFKSDVYSLGLVIFELETVGIWSGSQWRQVLENRKLLSAELSNFSLLFREKLIIKGKKILCLENILEMMLAEKETERAYLIELCLQANFSNIIMSKILVPHEQYFKSDIMSGNGTRKRIGYPHVAIEYEGQTKENTLIKEGKGFIFNNAVKVFEGDWRDNLPEGKCSINFSDYWKYEGFMKAGQFDSQGFLFFNGTRLNEGKWYNNLCEDRVDVTARDGFAFKAGYYFFMKSPKEKDDSKDFRVYYKQFVSEHRQYILNLFLIDSKLVAHTIVKFIGDTQFTHVSVHENQQKLLHNGAEYDVVQLGSNHQTITLMTAAGHARTLMLKLFETDAFKHALHVDVSNTRFNEDELRQLFEKPVVVDVLNISGCKIADKGMRILSISERARNLKSLNMSNLQITDKSLSEFMFSKAIENLEELSMSFCKNLSSQCIATFLCNQKLRKLKAIEIEATNFTHYGLEKVVKFNNFNKVETFNIGMCHKINDAYFNQFLRHPVCTSLKHLSINSTILTDSILQVLASSECHIESLDFLNLSGSINLSFNGLSKLFTSPKVANIVIINLSGTYIDDQFLQLLARKSCLKNKSVRQLYLSSCFSITDKGLGELLRSQNFVNLQLLDLSKTFASNDTLYALSDANLKKFQKLSLVKCQKISDLGLQKYLNSQSAKSLTSLDISFVGIQTATLVSLSESRMLPRLQRLRMEECTKIDEGSLIKYFKSKNFKTLTHLDLSGTLISNKSLMAFNENSTNYYRLIDLEIRNCRNITPEGLKHICLPNKFIFFLKKKDEVGKNSLSELASSQILLKMTTLNLSNSSEKDLPSLFESQYCCNINTIIINDSPLKSSFIAMQNSKYLKNVKKLSLKGCEIDEVNMRLFLMSENAHPLEQLDISWTLLSNKIMYALAESPHLNFLQSLRMSKCININDKGMERFFGSKRCSTLKDLDMRATLLTNYTLQAIAKSKFLKTLKRLNIRSCPNLKINGLDQLLRSVNCSSIRSLDLSWCSFPGDLFKTLKSSKYTSQLKELYVSGLKGIEHDLLNYINSAAANCIKTIDVDSCPLSVEAVLCLFQSEYLENVQEVNISNVSISKNTLGSILKSKNIERVHRLGLINSLASLDIIKLLSQHYQRLSRLEYIYMSMTKNINTDDIRKLLPKLEFSEHVKTKDNDEPI